MTPTLLALPGLGCTIATYETGNPAGPPLLLLPGNSLSVASTYAALWPAPALAHFRVVAFDWPGCGASPWAAAGVYGLPGLRRVLLAAWEALHLAGALVVAHSLAGHLVLDVLPQLPLLRGALLAAAPPVGDASSLGAAFRPDPRMGHFYQGELGTVAVEELLTLMLPPAQRPAHAAALRHALRQSDPAFRTALGADIVAGHFCDEVAAVAAANVPLLFVLGAEDAAISASYFATLPTRPALHRLPGAGHLPMLETPAAFVELVTALAVPTAASRAGSRARAAASRPGSSY